MEDRIRQLLAYSFLDGREAIPYENLTTRERAIISKDEYVEVIMFIRGEVNFYSKKKTKDFPLWAYIVTTFVSSIFGNIIYHIFIK